MINSSSALGESVQLQKQFPGFYDGTSQADSENCDEKAQVIVLWYASVLSSFRRKSTCFRML